MTRKSKTGGDGQHKQGANSSKTNGTRGIPQTVDSKKSWSINVLQGILPLDLSQSTTNGEGSGIWPIINRNGDGKQIEGRKSWADIVEDDEKTMGKWNIEENKEVNPKSWSKIVANPIAEWLDLTPQANGNLNVKITMEDIKEEIEHWNSAVVCYVLGSNPLQADMAGYFQRIWDHLE